MKLATIIRARINASPGFDLLTFPYNVTMLGALKKYPGCRWNEPLHGWLVPSELTKGFMEFAKERLGWTPAFDERDIPFDARIDPNPSAYKYQTQDVAKALVLKRAMFAWEMGLGKTLGAIEYMRQSKLRRLLVVCPAMARSVWEQELRKWWPKHPPIFTVRDGKAADAFGTEAGDEFLCITSYELLKKLRLPAKLECVVADESHYIKEAKVGRSKALRSILDKWSVPYRLFLTGTPITVNPIDIHNQVDCLYPGRLGHLKTFGDAYCGRVPNGYRYSGYDYDGVNQARADELLQRLGYFILRRTKAEVADQLPPLITQTIRLPADRSMEARIESALKGKGDLEAVLAEAESSKIEPIVKLIEEDFEGGATHVNITTYHHVAAEEIAGRLQDAVGGWDIKPVVFHLGKAPEKKRAEILEAARQEPLAIVVTTMKAINVGINSLANFSPSYCAELYSAPGTVTQWAGRFHRIGSTKPLIRFVVREGSDEERIAAVLERRMREHGKVVPKGQVDRAVLDAMEDDRKESPKDFMQRLRSAIAAGARDEDPYL